MTRGRRRLKVALYLPWNDMSRLAVFEGLHRFVLAHPELELASRHGTPFLQRAEISRVGADGLIALVTEEDRVAIKRLRLPTVCLGELADRGDFSVVSEDNRTMGRSAAEFLLARGFQHFAFLGVAGPLYSLRRQEGFVAALAAAGREPRQLRVPYSAQTRARALATCRAWVAKLPRPTAAYTANDHLGRLLIEAATAAGVAVPLDLAVLGSSGNPLEAMLSEPHLSTIPVDFSLMGYAAGELLLRRLRGEGRAGEVRLLPPQAVLGRESTDLFATEDPRLNRMLAHVRRHACRGLRVKELLQEFPMSRRTLNQMFARGVGHSPFSEILKVRLEQARFLLARTPMTIGEVAARSGFEDARHLMRSFRTREGMTPTSYRKREAAAAGTRPGADQSRRRHHPVPQVAR